jgi:hypothetical protein
MTSFIGVLATTVAVRTTAEEHRDLAEHVARAQRPDMLAVLEDVSGTRRDGEHRVAELALFGQGCAGVHVELAAGGCDVLPLVLVEVREHRDRRDGRGIHDGDATTGFLRTGYRSGEVRCVRLETDARRHPVP